MKFEAAIKFVPNFDFPKTVEGNRAHEGFRNLRTSIKIDTHPAYYKIQEETIGLKPQYGKVTSFIPNWKSATLYLLDSTTKQIILQKECQIINL